MAENRNTNAPVTIAIEALTESRTVPALPVGTKVEINGKGYLSVKFDNGSGNVASVANGLAYWLADADPNDFIVTMDVSDTKPNKVCGRFNAVLADGEYGFIQFRGTGVVTTNGDDDIAEGDAVIPSALGDGTADSVLAGTAPTYKVVGFARAADVDAANTVVVDLCL